MIDHLRTRAARAEDAASVWPLVASFATSFTPNRAAFETSFERALRHDETLVGVAEVGQSIGGYVLASSHLAFFANSPVVWVEEVMVAEHLRRTGVGAALMGFVQEWSDSTGAAYVSLATRRASAFYGALGFEASATFFRRLNTGIC